MSAGTLRKWRCRSNQAVAEATHLTELPNALAAVSCTAAQRLLALQQTHGLSSTVLHAWCREHALAEPLLIFWRDAFGATVTPQFRDAKLALRWLQSLNDGLQRELRRKEKSLAEAAA